MAEKEHIPFVKMQGTGNDFVVIDNRKCRFDLKRIIELTPELSHRKYGIGADGLLALQQPRVEGTDFEMLYRNADGSDAGMCGNGSRCLALFASRLGMGDELQFSVHDKIYEASVQNKHIVEIAFPVSTKVKEITVEGDVLLQVFTGTEHIALEVPDDTLHKEEELVSKGKILRYHDDFMPKGTNVNFFCGMNDQNISVQTYERGVENLTLACGTGAIASAIAWHYKQELDYHKNEIEVRTKGGELQVEFDYHPDTGTYSDIKLKGPAHFVFEGNYYV